MQKDHVGFAVKHHLCTDRSAEGLDGGFAGRAGDLLFGFLEDLINCRRGETRSFRQLKLRDPIGVQDVTNQVLDPCMGIGVAEQRRPFFVTTTFTVRVFIERQCPYYYLII